MEILSFNVTKTVIWISAVFAIRFPGCCHFKFLRCNTVVAIVKNQRSITAYSNEHNLKPFT